MESRLIGKIVSRRFRVEDIIGRGGMAIVYHEDRLREYVEEAVKISEGAPILIDKFLTHAIELDVDCVADGKTCVVGAILGCILAGAVLLVLHVFSLFINTLGAYAHCARLQFIEFFGKFYEADGHEFKPLRFNTRNVILRDK